MAAPTTDWTLIRITGHLRDFSANELTGTITFTPQTDYEESDATNITVLQSTLTGTFVAGILKDAALNSYMDIPATDDPDIDPVGFTYVMVITTPTKTITRTVEIPIAAPGGTLDLTDLLPVVGVGAYTPYATQGAINAALAVAEAYTDAAVPVLNLKDFAAFGDGTTIDTAALQAAVDSITTLSSSVPAVKILCGPGTYVFDDVVTITRKAIIFEGVGRGNPTSYATNPGKGTTFQWAGATGGWMFQIEDSIYMEFSNILFQGNMTNPPAAFIRHYNSGTASNGTNTRMLVNRCRFGSWPWSDDTTTLGTLSATAGVVFSGTNANNDKPIFRDCEFYSLGYGIDIQSSQSEWGVIDNCNFTYCLTAGVRTYANVTMLNATFQLCTKDVLVESTGHVDVFGFWSENSGQCAQLNGQGTLNIFGGTVLFSASMGANFIEHNSCGAEGGVGLYGFRVNNNGGTYTGKKLYVRGASGATTMGNVTVVGCTGIVAGMLDIAAAAAGVGIRVDIRSGALEYKAILTASAALTTSLTSAVGGMGGWTAKDQGFLAWTYDPPPAGSSQLLGTAGTMRVTKLKLDTACTVTNIHFWVGTVGSGLTTGQCFAALYDSAGALLSTTADLAAAWTTGTGLKTHALTTPQAVTAGYVFVACWFNGTTSPTMLCFLSGTGNMNLATVDSRYSTADTGRTTTAPSTLGTKSQQAGCYFVALT